MKVVTLELSVVVCEHGEDDETLRSRIESIVEEAMGNGLVTGDGPAVVVTWGVSAKIEDAEPGDYECLDCGKVC